MDWNNVALLRRERGRLLEQKGSFVGYGEELQGLYKARLGDSCEGKISDSYGPIAVVPYHFARGLFGRRRSMY